MIRHLALKLSTLKRYVGFVLGEIDLERVEVGTTSSIDILRERRDIVIIRMIDRNVRMTVTLIRPTKTPPINSASTTANTPRGEFFKRFTIDDVADFIAAVDDDNAIHRGVRPIVPGFLILETLIADRRFDGCKRIRLRFKRMIAVDEDLYLTFDGAQFTVDSDERKIEGWIFVN